MAVQPPVWVRGGIDIAFGWLVGMRCQQHLLSRVLAGETIHGLWHQGVWQSMAVVLAKGM